MVDKPEYLHGLDPDFFRRVGQEWGEHVVRLSVALMEVERDFALGKLSKEEARAKARKLLVELLGQTADLLVKLVVSKALKKVMQDQRPGGN